MNYQHQFNKYFVFAISTPVVAIISIRAVEMLIYLAVISLLSRAHSQRHLTFRLNHIILRIIRINLSKSNLITKLNYSEKTPSSKYFLFVQCAEIFLVVSRVDRFVSCPVAIFAGV